MYTLPRLITADDLVDRVQRRMRDVYSDRWQDEYARMALNDAIADWDGRVFTPHIYTITGGITATQQEYSLPSYMSGPLQVQRKIEHIWTGQVQDNSYPDYRWQPFHDFQVEPDGAGGQILRVYVSQYRHINFHEEARILWWAPPSLIPERVPHLGADVLAGADSLTLDEVFPDVSPYGWVKINNEYIMYGGATDESGVTVLSNLVRGYGTSTGASHADGDTVSFCVAIPDQRLIPQLYRQMNANMFHQYMIVAPSETTEHYQWTMQWDQQKAEEFWQSWAPNRPIQIRPSYYGAGAGETLTL